ncbi:glycosyl transferase family protein [Paracoccidioides lutzii Pb01]|uniref:Glycosyl transferase family protein n=1 Tax=Paracoccidioides lutzii (strain ATCC MYA-826 / Pb01) TaxID=502779 RepID=C1GNT1_PARBA|nr:glycosyl transferase family protein [Paracoccidioides lutzii Pb01]EEH35853.2 glycosyl transferase family protein [Paracoccidioides lutzii Pb01]
MVHGAVSPRVSTQQAAESSSRLAKSRDRLGIDRSDAIPERERICFTPRVKRERYLQAEKEDVLHCGADVLLIRSMLKLTLLTSFLREYVAVGCLSTLSVGDFDNSSPASPWLLTTPIECHLFREHGRCERRNDTTTTPCLVFIQSPLILLSASARTAHSTHIEIIMGNPVLVTSPAPRPAHKKVWTTLITNTAYLSGLLTLDYSLKKVGSKYPLVALYTDSFPPDGHLALQARGIPSRHVPYLLPAIHKDYSNDIRFYDCWSKLTPFSLVEYDRVVQLDSDMLVLRNMDELMDLELDDPELKGDGSRVFAATHACVCNPLKKPHYPKDWIPSNCALTTQHADPTSAQTQGAPSTTGLGALNGGLQVVNPCSSIYDKILTILQTPSATSTYEFADQSLLSDLFPGRWVPLPYIYNALRTLRWEGVHSEIWKDGNVKNVHYILNPKPWDGKWDGERVWDGERDDKNAVTDGWWWRANRERLEEEKKAGIVADGF